MKMTAVNSQVSNNPFEALNQRMRLMYGDEYFEKNLGAMDAFSRIAYTACEQNRNSREIEDLFPPLGVMYQHLDVFAKIWLINETQSKGVNYTDVLTLIMSDADRFMLNLFKYNFWENSDLNVNLIDGIPDTIHGDSRLIAKKIVKNRLTNDESQKLSALIRVFKSDMNRYHELIAYTTYPEDYIRTRPSYWPAWRYVHEARATGWFPFMVEQTKAEIQFCKDNGIPVENTKKPARRTSAPVSAQEEEINAGMAKALEELIGKLEEVNNYVPTAEEPKPEPINKDDVSDVIVVDMATIESIADMSGNYINSIGGIDSIVDKFVGKYDEGSAAFSIGTVFKGILTAGKKFVPGLIGILGPVIDFAVGGIKKSIINDPTDMPKSIEKVIPKTTQIAIDESVDKIEGLANLLRGIITELCIIRDAEDAQTQIDAIDRIAALLKDNLSMFNNSEFMKLIDRFMGKLFDLADEASISAETATETVVQEEDGSASMLPPTAMPAGAAAAQQQEMKDDGTPGWMKTFMSGIAGAMREDRAKFKPGFIEQANRDAKAAQTALPVPNHELDALTPNFKVDPALNKDYPWINQICGIAVKNGLAVSATPFYNMKADGEYEISAIRVESFVDGVPSKEKSFTIDLGHFLDRRVKMVFNYGMNGFTFMETCDDAYFVFDRNNDKIDYKIFEAIFKIGISSIKEDEKRAMRMYNSNVTKINRTIVWLTVPTWAVKGEERKALKDSIFKMEKTIRAMAKKNNINFGRFALYGFDPKTLSYTLDNAGVYYKGQPCNAPHFTYSVTIAKNPDGSIKKDAEGHAEVSCIINYIDNVFGPEGPLFPENCNTIYGSPEQNSELFTTGVDPTGEEFTVAVDDGDGEVPAVITNPERDEPIGATAPENAEPTAPENKRSKRGSKKSK